MRPAPLYRTAVLLIRAGASSGGTTRAKLVIVANAALIGVPAAYATSQSVLVTVLATTVAAVFVIVCALRRTR